MLLTISSYVCWPVYVVFGGMSFQILCPFLIIFHLLLASLVAQRLKRLPAMWETWVWSGEGKGNPLQYSCLENPMDRGAWWAAVHGVSKSQTRLSDFTFSLVYFISANSKCNATQGDKPVISCKKTYNYKVQFECSPSLLSSQRCRHTLRSYHL